MEKIEKTEAAVAPGARPRRLRGPAPRRPPSARSTGKYVNEKGDGVYRCAGCGNALFTSDTKFESGSGWPSFTDPMFGEAVETRTDTLARHGPHRGRRARAAAATSATCSTTGPATAALRYCINSCALDLDRQRRGVERDADSAVSRCRLDRAVRRRRVQPGLCATSHGWPSGSTKIPE